MSAPNTAFHRSFSREIVRLLETLKHVRIDTLATVQHGDHRYPLFLVQIPHQLRPGNPSILISGGVHGDEPAGVYAAIDFLSCHVSRYAEQANFFVLPCVNPSGYELATLESLSGANLNRSFGIGSTEPEIVAIEKWLSRERIQFRVTMDLHEAPPYYEGEGFEQSDNPKECYLYETVTDSSHRIGRELIDALPDSVEICRWPRVYLDDNVDGVISYPEGNRNPVYREKTTFDAFLNGRYTHHSFTTETPTCWSVDKRVETQLLWVKQALARIQA